MPTGARCCEVDKVVWQVGSKSIWKTKAEGSFEKSTPGGKVQLSPGILTVSIHSSCPYSYEKASHLLCMSAPEVSLVSASSHCTASRAWCQGGGSWRSGRHCGSVAGAAVQRQRVLSTLGQQAWALVVSSALAPACSQRLTLFLLQFWHLRNGISFLLRSSKSIGGSQSRILADTSKIIKPQSENTW